MEKHTKRGRPRLFDKEPILEAAMSAFWKQGFSATSYDVLEQATGLRRQSLVYAFGDKRALFLEALSYYFSTCVGEVASILERGGSDLENIRGVFNIWLASAEDKNKRGCLIVNTSGQFGASDQDIADIVNRAVESLRQAFSTAYKSAQASGEVIAHVCPEDLARLTVAAGNGALLHVHSEENTENTVQVLDSLLSIVTLPTIVTKK